MAISRCYLCDCSAIKSSFNNRGCYAVYCPGCGYYEIKESAISALTNTGFPIEQKDYITAQVRNINATYQDNVAHIDFSEGAVRARQRGNSIKS